MATVNDVYNLAKYIVNKEQNGYFTPDEFNLAAKQAENSYQDFLIGEVQQYQYQRGQARVHYGMNEIARQKLTPTIKNTTITIPSNGKFTYPTDYIVTDALLTTDNKRIRFASQDKLYSYLGSTIDPIASNPIYVLEQTNYHFYPENLASAKLSYVGNVVNMVWGYTEDTDGLPIYNESGITKLDVIFGGVGYTTPNITFSAPATGGVQATGTLTVVGGVITAVVMTNVGNGYAGLTPTFTITGSSTTPANFGSPIVSVQPVWDNTDIYEVTARVLKIVSANLIDMSAMSLANQVIKEGQ